MLRIFTKGAFAFVRKQKTECVDYRKRGSASYIVPEVRSVRERERERYRERERKRDRRK